MIAGDLVWLESAVIAYSCVVAFGDALRYHHHLLESFCGFKYPASSRRWRGEGRRGI